MNDNILVVKPQGLQEKTLTKTVPVYAVELTGSGSKGTKIFFIASKLEVDATTFVKCIGTYFTGTEEALSKNYNEILSAPDKSGFIEVMFPWHRVLSIKNLIFRHK